MGVVRGGAGRRWAAVLGCSAALACAAALVPAAAAAQGGTRIIPQVGLYVPLADPGQVESGSQAVDIAKMESTLGLGLAIEFGARETLSFRVNGVYGTASDVPVSAVSCAGCEARSTVAVVTGSVVLRPLPSIIVAQPYLQGGLGLKRYDFDEEDARAEEWSAFLSDQNKLTGQLGAGVEVNVLFATLLVEVSDFISGFDIGGEEEDEDLGGDTQHDFFVTVGLAIGG